MFPLLSTSANPLGPLLFCDRTSAYPTIMQSEKPIRGMTKRITIPPGARFESTRRKLAIATILICMPTALSAASLFNFEVIHANAGPKRGAVYLSRMLAFTEKLELPTVNAASRSGWRGQHVVSMISAKNRGTRKQEGVHHT